MARKRLLWTLAPTVVVLAVGTVAWQTSDLGRAARDLDRQRAAAKREGVPMEWDDLRRLEPPVATADNAAVSYARAFAAFRASGAFKGLMPLNLLKAVANGTATPAELAALRAGLAKAAPALAEVREGTGRKGFSFDRQWEKGWALLFPEYTDAQGVARALVLRAMLARDPASAAADLRDAAVLRARVGSELVTIAAFVGNSLESDVHRGIRLLGRRGGAWIVAMRPVLDDLGPIPPLRRTLAAEAVGGTHAMAELQKLGPQAFGADLGSSTPVVMRLAGLRPVRDAFDSRIVEYWRNAWAKLPQDPTDFRAAEAALPMPSSAQGASYAMLELLLPAFSQFAQTNAKVEADRRLSRAALDLWSGAMPTLPKDPFSAGPLKLKRHGGGWTLYSVGPDGKDDGGKPQAKPSGANYDMVVER